MGKTFRVLVTGDREDWAPVAPTEKIDSVEWKSVPVLRYERLTVKPELLERLSAKPTNWIIFQSPRSVHFWSEVLMEGGYDFPVETRVACLGDRTAEAAEQDGFSVDFYPKEPGTEGFLSGFESLLRSEGDVSVLIPAAEGGRPKLKERLRELRCEVLWVPLYRTLKNDTLASSLSQGELLRADAVVFTSPTSIDAFLDEFSLPPSLTLIAIGSYTGRHLDQRGFSSYRQLPGGDFRRIGEVLC